MTMTIEALSARVEALEKKGPATTQIETLSGTVTALTARLEKSETNVTALQAELVKRDRAALVERAAREGKEIPLTPAEIEQTPIATLSAMIEKLKPTVPLKRETPERVVEHTPEAQAEASRAAEIRTLAAQIQNREGLSWPAAWSRASAQVKKPAAG